MMSAFQKGVEADHRKGPKIPQPLNVPHLRHPIGGAKGRAHRVTAVVITGDCQPRQGKTCRRLGEMRIFLSRAMVGKIAGDDGAIDRPKRRKARVDQCYSLTQGRCRVRVAANKLSPGHDMGVADLDKSGHSGDGFLWVQGQD